MPRLEYIESTGTQWIDSGVNGATGLKFIGDLEWNTSHSGSSAKADWMLVGARKDTSTDTRIIPIYIEETVAAPILADIRKFDERPSPAIILIPGRDGPIGLGQSALQEAVEKAVGSNIL